MKSRVAPSAVAVAAASFVFACSADRAGQAVPGVDAGADAAPLDLGVDATPPDLGEDAEPVDLGGDLAMRDDLGADMEAPPEDLGTDLGVDLGTDSGTDLGVDLGADLGTDAGCTPAADGCRAGVQTRCVGGVLQTTMCPLGCSTAAPDRCAVLVPSNVPASLFDGATMDRTLSGNFDTTECNTLGAAPAGPGDAYCVLRGRDLTVPSGAIFTVSGARPLILLASRDVTITGTIDAAARGTTPGPAGAPPGLLIPVPGSGGDGMRRGFYGDGGGGGGGLCGAGGAGGRGTDGSGNAAAGGAGGTAPLVASDLVPLRGGSAGGRGSDGIPSAAGGPDPDWLGRGGAGGGAVQISARGSITLNGEINVGGGGGEGGNANANYGAGGGGGSGGAVLLEAPTITFARAARVWAIGGGGGGAASGSGVPGGTPGGNGQDGRLSMSRALGGTTGGMTYGAPGGSSGGRGAMNGANGGSNTNNNANGGGGGGGVGCVVLRNAGGTLPDNADLGAPQAGMGLRTLAAAGD